MLYEHCVSDCDSVTDIDIDIDIDIDVDNDIHIDSDNDGDIDIDSDSNIDSDNECVKSYYGCRNRIYQSTLLLIPHAINQFNLI